MKRIITTVAATLLLITAGCTGGANPATTTTAPVTNTTTATTPASTTTANTAPSTESTGAKAFQTGNKTGVASRVVTGDTFLVYYDAADDHALVKLADVSVPSMNKSEITPVDFGYHEAATESEAANHSIALQNVGYDAATSVENHLNRMGGAPTIVHSGETTADGTPLVYIYFTDDGEEMLYNEYVLRQGFGVLTASDSPHASALSAAQEDARENDTGLWEYDEASEEWNSTFDGAYGLLAASGLTAR